MNAGISRVVAAVWPHTAWQHTLWPHVHDISVSALAVAVATLGVVILVELRSVLKLRQVVDGNLARMFEQLDLLRFESQQLIEGQQLIEARARGGTASLARQGVPVQAPPSHSPQHPLQNPLQNHGPPQQQTRPVAAPVAAVASVPAAPAAAPATAGEARLLSSLAQARARREAAGPLQA